MDYLRQNLIFNVKKLYKHSIEKMLLLFEEHGFDLDVDERIIDADFNTPMISAHEGLLASVMSIPILFVMAFFGVISGYHFIYGASILPLIGFVFYVSSYDGWE